jgi:hypothetical protein
MIHQHLSDAANRWLDWLAILFAGVSVVGVINQVAVVVSILAGIGSLSLIALRWFDRIKYGRGD